MTGKEIFKLMEQGQMPPRIPFVPVFYEHIGKLLGTTPSEVAVNEDLIVEGQLQAYEQYEPDLISVGVDIYNVECEALGAEVRYYENETIPSIEDNLIKEKEELDALSVPDPENAGRMPVFLGAAERINEKVKNEVNVSGTIVGPFTMAALLRGFENFVNDMLLDENFARELLSFCREVAFKFAEGYIKRNVGVVINESWISPPLMSPDLYKDFVFPEEKKLITEIKRKGQNNVALICGGDTTPIADYLIETGSSLLIADSNADWEYYKNLCKEHNIFLRANIDSGLVEKGAEPDIKKKTEELIDICGDYNKFIFGCGVVSYDTDPEDVLKLKEIVSEIER